MTGTTLCVFAFVAGIALGFHLLMGLLIDSVRCLPSDVRIAVVRFFCFFLDGEVVVDDGDELEIGRLSVGKVG